MFGLTSLTTLWKDWSSLEKALNRNALLEHIVTNKDVELLVQAENARSQMMALSDILSGLVLYHLKGHAEVPVTLLESMGSLKYELSLKTSEDESKVIVKVKIPDAGEPESDNCD